MIPRRLQPLILLLKPACIGFVLFLFLLIPAFIIAALTGPTLVPIANAAFAKVLSYEVLMRLYLGVMVFVVIYAATLLLNKKKLFAGSVVWLWITYAIMTVVFLGDQKWTITEENSWIKYPTAFFLILAAFFIFKKTRQKASLRVGDKIRLGVLAAGLLFASQDELFSFHERMGALVENSFRLSHTTTDLITLGYGIIGIVVLIFVLPVFWQTTEDRKNEFGVLMFFGMALFVFATLLDTFDLVVFSWLRSWGDWWAGSRFFLGSNLWQDYLAIIYKPALFMNGIEEVSEMFAAAAFAFAASRLHKTPHESTTRRSLPRALSLALVCAFGILIMLGMRPNDGHTLPIEHQEFIPYFDWKSTLVYQGGAFVSVGEGLYHADDLAYHHAWGVVVANESWPERGGTKTASGVFTYRKGKLTRVGDPQGMLSDIDSVTVDAEAIYATSGALGKIFVYASSTLGWSELQTTGPAPKHPEGIAIGPDNNLIILDESDGSITHITKTGKVLQRVVPVHPDWGRPEGIAYHPGLKGFLITDDIHSVVFLYRPNEPLQVFLDKNDGLDAPEDIAVDRYGMIIITDNGACRIMFFDEKGYPADRDLPFRRLWCDLQGVATDGRDLFVITADGYGSSSFVPSVLWEIVRWANG